MAAQRLITLGEALFGPIVAIFQAKLLTNYSGSSPPCDEASGLGLHDTQRPSASGNKSTQIRELPHPYAHVSYRKTPRPPAVYSPDIHVVEGRCRNGGGEEDAIAILHVIFSNGVSEMELTRKVSREEADRHCGGFSMQAYRMLLRNGEAGRYHCRLCPDGANEGGWKNARDVLRHLKRDHFGLGTSCSRW